jgi:DNA-binding LacI/PurR family transcriptional regulator
MASARWQEIVSFYTSKIDSGALKPGDPIPPEIEIAKNFNVSRQTAHRAMTEMTRGGLIERRRRWGTRVSPKKITDTGVIGLLFVSVTDWLEADLIRGIHRAVAPTHRLLLNDTFGDPDREAALARTLATESDGVIILPTLGSAATQQAICDLQAAGKPVIAVDRAVPNVVTDVVCTDNYAVSRQAVISVLDRGHKRVAFFTGDNEGMSSVADRQRGVEDALQEHGRSLEGLVRVFDKASELKPTLLHQAVRDAVFALRHGPKPIDAIFCVQEVYTQATLEACRELDIRVPEDVEIVGFHDWPTTLSPVEEEITRIRQNHEQIGRAAAELLLARLNGSVGEKPKSIEVPASILPASRLS